MKRLIVEMSDQLDAILGNRVIEINTEHEAIDYVPEAHSAHARQERVNRVPRARAATLNVSVLQIESSRIRVHVNPRGEHVGQFIDQLADLRRGVRCFASKSVQSEGRKVAAISGEIHGQRRAILGLYWRILEIDQIYEQRRDRYHQLRYNQRLVAHGMNDSLHKQSIELLEN